MIPPGLTFNYITTNRSHERVEIVKIQACLFLTNGSTMRNSWNSVAKVWLNSQYLHYLLSYFSGIAIS